MTPKKFSFFFHFIAEINRFITKHDVIFEFTPEVMIVRSSTSRPVEGEPESSFKSVMSLKMICIEEFTVFVPRRDNKIWFGMSNTEFKNMVDKLSLSGYYTAIDARLEKVGDKVW